MCGVSLSGGSEADGRTRDSARTTRAGQQPREDANGMRTSMRGRECSEVAARRHCGGAECLPALLWCQLCAAGLVCCPALARALSPLRRQRPPRLRRRTRWLAASPSADEATIHRQRQTRGGISLAWRGRICRSAPPAGFASPSPVDAPPALISSSGARRSTGQCRRSNARRRAHSCRCREDGCAAHCCGGAPIPQFHGPRFEFLGCEACDVWRLTSSCSLSSVQPRPPHYGDPSAADRAGRVHALLRGGLQAAHAHVLRPRVRPLHLVDQSRRRQSWPAEPTRCECEEDTGAHTRRAHAEGEDDGRNTTRQATTYSSGFASASIQHHPRAHSHCAVGSCSSRRTTRYDASESVLHARSPRATSHRGCAWR